MTAGKGLEFRTHANKRLAVVLVSYGYFDCFAPVGTRLSGFTVPHAGKLYYLFVGRGLIMCSSERVFSSAFFFAVAERSIALRKAIVPVYKFIHSLRVSH